MTSPGTAHGVWFFGGLAFIAAMGVAPSLCTHEHAYYTTLGVGIVCVIVMGPMLRALWISPLRAFGPLTVIADPAGIEIPRLFGRAATVRWENAEVRVLGLHGFAAHVRIEDGVHHAGPAFAMPQYRLAHLRSVAHAGGARIQPEPI